MTSGCFRLVSWGSNRSPRCGSCSDDDGDGGDDDGDGDGDGDGGGGDGDGDGDGGGGDDDGDGGGGDGEARRQVRSWGRPDRRVAHRLSGRQGRLIMIIPIAAPAVRTRRSSDVGIEIRQG
jgi:hypothetical protein